VLPKGTVVRACWCALGAEPWVFPCVNRDFDIDCVLDEETQVNIITERTWETLGKPAMIPSLGGIGLFRGKMINLCGKLTHISMRAHGTSIEE
jgi:hypothetical protein